jgi:hypothetical protein
MNELMNECDPREEVRKEDQSEPMRKMNESAPESTHFNFEDGAVCSSEMLVPFY